MSNETHESSIFYIFQIVAPFNGYIYDTSEFGSPQVTIDVEDLKDTQVIIDNVQLKDEMNRKQVLYLLCYFFI